MSDPQTTIRARIVFILLAALLTPIVARPVDARAATRQPDIILIITDDQRSDTMRYMPFTSSFFGTVFDNAFITNPTCCPSRTTIMTGTYSYTNGVWTNEARYGGWPQFQAHGWADRSVATILQDGGYVTGLFGKFLNVWDDTIPSGWDRFAGHAAAGLHGADSPYYDYTLRYEDGSYEDFGHDPEDYSGDVLTQQAIAFLDDRPYEPHFIYLSLNAPHSANGSTPPVPGPAEEAAAVVPFSFTPNFLESDIGDKPAYIGETQDEPRPVSYYRHWNKAYARSLLSVDGNVRELVEAQMARDPGLDDTLFLFIGDNGLEIGNHRRSGKAVPYEESIHVPLLAQGYSMVPGTVDDLVTNVDLFPTILQAAGLTAPWPVEGTSLFTPAHRRYVLIEGAADAHSFCGVRLRHSKLVRYGSGEWEFYNLRTDPYELASKPGAARARALRAVARDACSGRLPPGWPRLGL